MAGEGIILQDEHTRKAIDQKVTIGDFCQEAIELMVESDVNEQTFTVLYKGAIYYIHTACVGINPPYTMKAEGKDTWLGQQAS